MVRVFPARGSTGGDGDLPAVLVRPSPGRAGRVRHPDVSSVVVTLPPGQRDGRVLRDVPQATELLSRHVAALIHRPGSNHPPGTSEVEVVDSEPLDCTTLNIEVGRVENPPELVLAHQVPGKLRSDAQTGDRHRGLRLHRDVDWAGGVRQGDGPEPPAVHLAPDLSLTSPQTQSGDGLVLQAEVEVGLVLLPSRQAVRPHLETELLHLEAGREHSPAPGLAEVGVAAGQGGGQGGLLVQPG